MLKDKLMKLFKDYEPDVQKVVEEVLALEQEHISLERFKYKESIKEIIDGTVKK